MPYLTIAAVTVPISDGQGVRQQAEVVGSSTRSFNGTLRTTRRAAKRQWAMRTELMSVVDCNTLEAAIALGAHVTCAGDGIGGSVICEVTVVNAGDQIAGATGFMRMLSLLLREV